MVLSILVFLAGTMQTAMGSFNGVLRAYIGTFGTTLATHVVGGVLLLLYILLIRRERLRLGPMPWYLYSAGFLGLALVASSALCVARIGSAVQTCLGISGQLVFSILMDHFGWMGMRKTPFDPRRIPRLLVILGGLVAVNFGGLTAVQMGEGALFYVLLAFVMGGVNVLSKTVNFQAAEHLGTYSGTLINYLVASALSVVLLGAFEPQYAAPAVFGAAPPWLYLGGVFGVAALVINVISLKKIDLLQSTVLLLLGNLIASAVLDTVLFHSMTWLKLLGVVIVGAGVIWDKRATITKET